MNDFRFQQYTAFLVSLPAIIYPWRVARGLACVDEVRSSERKLLARP